MKTKRKGLALMFALVFGLSLATIPTAFAGTEDVLASEYRSYGFNKADLSSEWTLGEGVTSSAEEDIAAEVVNESKMDIWGNQFLVPMQSFTAPFTVEMTVDLSDGDNHTWFQVAPKGSPMTNSNAVVFADQWGGYISHWTGALPIDGNLVGYNKTSDTLRLSVDANGNATPYLNGVGMSSGGLPAGLFAGKVTDAETGNVIEANIGVCFHGGVTTKLLNFKVTDGADGKGKVLFSDDFRSNNCGNGLQKWAGTNESDTVGASHMTWPTESSLNFKEATDKYAVNKTAIDDAGKGSAKTLRFSFSADLSADKKFGAVFGLNETSDTLATDDTSTVLWFSDTKIGLSGAQTVELALPAGFSFSEKNLIEVLGARDGDSNAMKVYSIAKGFADNRTTTTKTLLATFLNIDTNGYFGFTGMGGVTADVFSAELMMDAFAATTPPTINCSNVIAKVYVGETIDLTPVIKDDFDDNLQAAVSVKDNKGNEVSKSMNFTTDKEGVYTVNYSAVNSFGFTGTATRTVVFVAKDTMQSFDEDFEDALGEGFSLTSGASVAGGKLTVSESSDKQSFLRGAKVKNLIATFDVSVKDLAGDLSIVFGRIDSDQFHAIVFDKNATTVRTVGLGEEQTADIGRKLWKKDASFTVRLTVTGSKVELSVIEQGESLNLLNEPMATFEGAIHCGAFGFETSAIDGAKKGSAEFDNLRLINTGRYEEISDKDDPTPPEDNKPGDNEAGGCGGCRDNSSAALIAGIAGLAVLAGIKKIF